MRRAPRYRRARGLRADEHPDHRCGAPIEPRPRDSLRAPSSPSSTPRTTQPARCGRPSNFRALAAAAQAHDFIVLADEIYEKILYDGAQHISIASLPGMWERTLILNGLSKSHAMTGWRLGFIAGPEPLIAELLQVDQHSTTCATSFVQEAAVAALNGPQEYTEYMVSRYKARRDRLVADLNAIPAFAAIYPRARLRFPRHHRDRPLLSGVHRAAARGGGGGCDTGGCLRSGWRWIRAPLLCRFSDETLQEGARRIKRFVDNLSD